MADLDLVHRRAADRILNAAIAEMEERGVPESTLVDRLLTHAAGYAARDGGKGDAAKRFREIADMVVAGLFDQVGGIGKN